MKNMINRTNIEGYVYNHDLQLRESGPNSKNPGTKFIMGNLEIATDDAMTNIVSVHFSYVTATTSKGNANATFNVLSQIIDGTLGNIMKDGVDKAAKLRISSAIGLNDFYTERNGEVTLVSAKRNEGGFINVVATLNPDEKTRNTFDTDLLITNVIRQEANPDREIPERVIVKGAVFDFRGALLPVEFIAVNPGAMDYFEDLGASPKEPVFTHVRGRQVSTTVVRKIEEPSAFGESSIREVTNTRKEFVITWAAENVYPWDDPSSITAKELTEAMAQREMYLASVKQRRDEYNASKGQVAAAAPKAGAFNF